MKLNSVQCNRSVHQSLMNSAVQQHTDGKGFITLDCANAYPQVRAQRLEHKDTLAASICVIRTPASAIRLPPRAASATARKDPVHGRFMAIGRNFGHGKRLPSCVILMPRSFVLRACINLALAHI